MALLDSTLERLMGYASRADVLLENLEEQSRVWIEFEVSRADPVANHAKFATAHLFCPWSERDTFVAMVSSHVSRGRRNLAANTIGLMRQLGIQAFQICLFPKLNPVEIQHYNHLDVATLRAQSLDAAAEVERVFAVSGRIAHCSQRRIHFVGEPLEVLLNLRQWNRDLASAEGRLRWGRRTVTYFVFDPNAEGLFAPAKFCAYSALPLQDATQPHTTSTMTVSLYTEINADTPGFDGTKARHHLVEHLGMECTPVWPVQFEQWLLEHRGCISVHPSGPRFLLLPTWLR